MGQPSDRVERSDGSRAAVAAKAGACASLRGCWARHGSEEWDREVMGTCQRPHLLAGGFQLRTTRPESTDRLAHELLPFCSTTTPKQLIIILFFTIHDLGNSCMGGIPLPTGQQRASLKNTGVSLFGGISTAGLLQLLLLMYMYQVVPSGM